jgi:hypothetical protein
MPVSEFAVGQPTSASEDPAAVPASLPDGAFVGLDRVLGDHRSEVDVAFERVADLDPLRFLDQQSDELLANRSGDIDT